MATFTEFLDEIDTLTSSNSRIEAIKRIREVSGWELRRAKEAHDYWRDTGTFNLKDHRELRAKFDKPPVTITNGWTILYGDDKHIYLENVREETAAKIAKILQEDTF